MVKDILREIKRKWFQFVALIIITALGVGFFIGIRVTGYDMRQTGDLYSETTDMLDLSYRHTLGIDEAMLADIQALVEGEVIGVVEGDVYLDNEVVHLIGFDGNTAKDLTLASGRLPEQQGEAVMDADMQEALGLEIGTVLQVSEDSYFEAQTVTVVGFVKSNMYMNRERGSTQLGTGSVSGFVYAQDLKHTEGVYTSARIRVQEGVDVTGVKSLLEGQNAQLTQSRFDRLVAPETEKLIEAQTTLDDERAKANDAFASQFSQLENARLRLVNAELQLRNALSNITGALEPGSLRSQYQASQAAFQTMMEQADAELLRAQAYIDSLPEASDKEFAQQELEVRKQTVALQKAEAVAAYAQIDTGIREYETGLLEYQRNYSLAVNAQNEANSEFDKAQTEINEGYETIQNTDRGKSYVQNRGDAVIGYTAYYQDSERIEGIGEVFPLIFFGVAILVTLSTVTRMIEESRTQIGIYKAIGYGWFRASFKFIGFTLLSWILGVVLGIVIGFYMIPTLIYDAYRIMYLTPELENGFVFAYAWLPILISFVSSVLVAFVKSLQISRIPAAHLMRPPLPKNGQRLLIEKAGFIWTRLSFLYKVSIRNLFRNKVRMLMTIVGVGGCCGLLITAFGLQNSIQSIADKQFGEIMHYEGMIAYEGVFTPPEDLESYINIQSEKAAIGSVSDVTVFAVEDFPRLSEFIALKDRVTQEPITYDDSTVIITEKMAETLNLHVGDTLSYTSGENAYQLTVGAITENYVLHYVYMSEAMYTNLTQQTFTPNLVLFDYQGDHQHLSQELLQQEDVLSVLYADDLRATQAEMMGNFDIVIFVVVIAAFALELIVLMNLITMNIAERQKELATLKVLGFYAKELASYILRENILLTLISALIGCLFGYYLHQFVILSAEINAVMFNRELLLQSYLLSVVLTFAISLLINFLMARRANRVNMSEALKTFDA